ncbi:hypothetical protein LINPERHAP1_LOCUS38989 [Linum perenne]
MEFLLTVALISFIFILIHSISYLLSILLHELVYNSLCDCSIPENLEIV